MTLASLAIFAGALLVAAGSPGPSVAALIARVLSRGPRDVLPFLSAMWVGEAVWLSLAVENTSLVAPGLRSRPGVRGGSGAPRTSSPASTAGCAKYTSSSSNGRPSFIT